MKLGRSIERGNKCDARKMNSRGQRLWPQAPIPLSAQEFLHWQEEHWEFPARWSSRSVRREESGRWGHPGGPGVAGGPRNGPAIVPEWNHFLIQKKILEMVSYGNLTLLSLKAWLLNPHPCEILSLKSVFPSIWHGNPGWYVRWS